MIVLYIILGIIGFLILLNIVVFLIVLKSHNKIFNTRFTPSPLVTYYDAKEYNLDSKKIEINCDNEIIRGNIYTCGDYDKNKIIIFCHGMNACKEAYMQEIGTLCQNGFMVLGYDHLGVNESDGKLKGISASIKSLDYVINYVKKNDELKNKDIYVVGHSWGAYATINIVKYQKDIKGIVALAPFVNVSSYLRYSMKMKNPFIILMIKLIELIKFGKYADCDGLKSLEEYDGKVLLIQSTNYNYAVGFLKNNLKDKCEYIILEDRLHNPDYKAEAVKYLNEFMSNIKKYKGKELEEYFKKQDFHKMGELDMNVMKNIINFINK